MKLIQRWAPSLVLWLTALIAASTTVVNVVFAENENHWLQSLALISYGVLISVFLLALIVGFVLSQIQYDEDIESPKNKILEIEGIQTCKIQR